MIKTARNTDFSPFNVRMIFILEIAFIIFVLSCKKDDDQIQVLIDGEIVYLFATCFSQVNQSLGQEQRNQLETLADDLGYIGPEGGFLYPNPIPMPEIENADFLFNNP